MNYLIGASGHGLVILDILSLQQIEVDGFLDDGIKPKIFAGKPCNLRNSIQLNSSDKVLISIGNNVIRKKIENSLSCSFLTAVHPSAVIDKTSEIGIGTTIMANAVINSNAKIGQHVIINTGSIVEHECIINDFVHISPNATLCGNVKVGEGAHIGAGAVIIPNISIGKGVIVGAGSVIIRDIPDNVMVVGNPGKIIKSLNNFF
jgi:acetyltransferase EpsM